MNKVPLIVVFTGIIACSALVHGCGRVGAPPSPPVAPPASRLSELLTPRVPDAYPLALAPREFSFPEDHGPHPDYRNEWWYVTGNLDSSEGRRFGFELTIFRFALTPGEEGKAGTEASAWATRQLYIGHFAVTDVEAGRFHVAQRHARGTLGLAGATARPFRVWVEDWHVEDAADGWRLFAADRGVEVSVSLQAVKEPVLNGIDGLSQKSHAPGNASYYYSVPRLHAQGSLTTGGETHDVSGLAWLDREWGSSALSDEQVGWDWFALQFSDGSDLMFYHLRRMDGTADPHSAGTFMPAEGDSEPLLRDEVTIAVRKFWDSPQGGRYPVAWTIAIPRLDLVLQVDPVLEAQELQTIVRYWEGAVDVTGSRSGRAIGGRGYVELTGYATE